MRSSFSTKYMGFWSSAHQLLRRRCYYSGVYNMGESEGWIGTSQTFRAIVDFSQRSYWKAVLGRQEWASAIEMYLGW